MFKNLSVLGLVTLAVCLVFGVPAMSHAQGYGYPPGYAPGTGGYTPGYGGVAPGYAPTQGYGGVPPGYGFPATSAPGSNFGLSYPPVVHPTYEHWTPGRGWHEHGHIHVPHYGHSHTRPY
jgi:hypothetical protein